MAFNFLGTFTEDQFEALFAFAQAQLSNVDPRVRYLKSQIERLGWILYDFDTAGNRINYEIQPVNSQLAKYSRAYEYYGGALVDLQIRSRGDWIYIQKGTFDLTDSKAYSGGIPSKTEGYSRGSNHLNDAAPAEAVSKVKDWIIPSIKKKREDLEYRIKRTIDLTDQHIEEIVLLIMRSSGSETLDQLRQDIEFFIASDEFQSAGVS